MKKFTKDDCRRFIRRVQSQGNKTPDEIGQMARQAGFDWRTIWSAQAAEKYVADRAAAEAASKARAKMRHDKLQQAITAAGVDFSDLGVTDNDIVGCVNDYNKRIQILDRPETINPADIVDDIKKYHAARSAKVAADKAYWEEQARKPKEYHPVSEPDRMMPGGIFDD